MKKRLVYGFAVVLLLVSVTLVVSLGSMNLGQYGPADSHQTFIFWALSSLIFLLMVTLGFILFRTGVKLYIERQSKREGSRIRTKLVVGALMLSFLPVFFHLVFSFLVLNHNLNAWFSRPAKNEIDVLVNVAELLQREIQEEAKTQAALLAAQPEVRRTLESGERRPGFLERFSKEQGLASASILGPSGNKLVDAFGPRAPETGDRPTVTARQAVTAGAKTIGYVELVARVPLDVAQQKAAIQRYYHEWAQFQAERKNIRVFYSMLIALITLFVLFVATWIALFVAKQISVPITALLDAAREVRRGNLKHRVNVRAVDELASLVRGFNRMTEDLEANARELDRRRRFTEAILESIPTGVISIAADGSIKRVNHALSNILPPQDVARATHLDDLFSREDIAELRYLMKRARRTGAATRQIELRTGNHVLHVAVTVSALEEKLTSGFVVVLEDTSELLRAQKAAAWHEVARSVAHEIKNPLTPIALSAERIARHLDRSELPPETARIAHECAATIAKSVESVKTLVDEFSRFARFPTAQPVRSDLNEVVEDALAVFQGRLEGITILTNFVAGLPAVNLDRGQFQRVVVNLVDNAAEAMQESLVKNLYIGTQQGAADTVELVIADSGAGVSAEDKEKLFLPYFSTKNRGTGLGLAIVSRIVAEHNAQIRVEDNQPAGARFTVEIPALPESEPAASGVRPAAANV
ncbi:MAG TPA: ATP-binding protein [Bryobacteraceae bacterium]|nr:ATP-binding protein [Bryobacteraceae bacterium]